MRFDHGAMGDIVLFRHLLQIKRGLPVLGSGLAICRKQILVDDGKQLEIVQDGREAAPLRAALFAKPGRGLWR